jgi:hypothetical protein
MFIVAGEIVAKVSGQPWSIFVQERIMKPLGMNETAGLYKNLESQKNVAFPHNSEHGKVVQLEKYDMKEKDGAAAGIVSSVHDMSKWLLMNLNNGLYGEKLEQRLVSEKSLNEIKKPHIIQRFNATPSNPEKNHYRAYGLGWGVKDVNGYTQFSHTGGLPGMLSQTVLIPELNFALVVLTNASPGGLSLVTIPNEIIESYTGVENGRDWLDWAKKRLDKTEHEADSVLKEVWEATAKADNQNIKLENLTGTYHDNWFGDVVIELKKNELIIKSLRSPKLKGKLLFYKDKTFAIQWDYVDMECSAFAHFTMDENGQAQTISMEGISPDIDFSFDFHHLNFKKTK